MTNKNVLSEENIEKFSKLNCILFPGRGKRCMDQYFDLYNKSYIFWREMMKEAFNSENLKELAEKLTSDDFVRHEEFVCLFFENEPVGLLMFDWMDFQSQSAVEHSYFSRYPDGIVDDIKNQSHRIIMTIGHLTVHPDWRKSKIGPGISEILTGFMTRRFLESHATALVFLTRNTRSTNNLGQEHGGKCLKKNFNLYGVSADVIIIYRHTIKPSNMKGVTEITEHLWKKKHIAILNPLPKLNKNITY